MAYDPRSRLIATEADEKYSEEVAKQNIRTSSVKSIIIIGVLIALLIGTILIMGI
ncbi:MAG: hypothetical protein KAJ76_10575 [Candidatus Heimdallarchaeota archaeon]|nr:hypothetical protein [Candidatus Heimdallarchaeota archaeon]